jgi:hypothetical protein
MDRVEKFKRVCVDCRGENPGMFVVRNEIWDAVAQKREALCLGCFQKRLGRPITFTDLKECGWRKDFAVWMAIFAHSNEEERKQMEEMKWV